MADALIVVMFVVSGVIIALKIIIGWAIVAPQAEPGFVVYQAVEPSEPRHSGCAMAFITAVGLGIGVILGIYILWRMF